MAKMGCAKCGGTKKMALGGSAVKKAPVQLYGIPQENMGTSSQMGFGRKGGSVKKMQVGGTAVPKKPLVKAQAGRTTGKPTADSTAYYKENIKIINKDIKNEPNTSQGKQNKYGKFGLIDAKSKAYNDLNRQKFKGKPGYDKNGFPIKKK